jgi:hypothetical protein
MDSNGKINDLRERKFTKPFVSMSYSWLPGMDTFRTFRCKNKHLEVHDGQTMNLPDGFSIVSQSVMWRWHWVASAHVMKPGVERIHTVP